MTPSPDAESSTGPRQVVEGNFSLRKIKIATAVLVGQTFATSILPYSALTFVMIPMTREFGWTRTQFSFATTFLFIFGAASLWPIGRIADRVGVRPVILVGTTMVGLVTIAMSRQTASLALLFAFYTLLGTFGSTGVAYTKVAAALFTQNRGKALAILGAESTVAAAIIPILTNFLMLNYGWRTMHVVFGALILAMVPILYFTIEEPGQIGINCVRAGPTRPLHQTPLPLRRLRPNVRRRLRCRAHPSRGHGARRGAEGLGVLAHHGCRDVRHAHRGRHDRAHDSRSDREGLQPDVCRGDGLPVHARRNRRIARRRLRGGSVSDRQGGRAVQPVGGRRRVSADDCDRELRRRCRSGRRHGARRLRPRPLYRPMGPYFQTRFFGLGSFTEIMSFQYMITNPVSAFSAPLVGVISGRTHSYHIAFMLMAISPLLAAFVWLVLPKYRYSVNIGVTMVPAPKQREEDHRREERRKR